MKEINLSSKIKMHIFICTNNKEEKGIIYPSCGPKITREHFKEIKLWLKKQNLDKDILCSRTHCLGFCNKEGGVIAIYPQKKFFTEIKNIEEIKETILIEYEKLSL